MRSYAEVAGRDLVWQGDIGYTIPDTGDFHFALYDARDLVATAHAMWVREQYFNVTIESGDGLYYARMDMTRNDRPTTAWKDGDTETIAAMSVGWELIIACGGPVTTRTGRQLLLEPTHRMGYEYAIFPEGGARILTLAAFGKTIPGLEFGANPGHMSVEPASAADPELPALVAMAFAVANEETRLLHQPTREMPFGGFDLRPR